MVVVVVVVVVACYLLLQVLVEKASISAKVAMEAVYRKDLSLITLLSFISQSTIINNSNSNHTQDVFLGNSKASSKCTAHVSKAKDSHRTSSNSQSNSSSSNSNNNSSSNSQ